MLLVSQIALSDHRILSFFESLLPSGLSASLISYFECNNDGLNVINLFKAIYFLFCCCLSESFS